ncbi:MAG: peptidyl-prolyl cis-trans isomerase [Gaiellaceae bacterium]
MSSRNRLHIPLLSLALVVALAATACGGGSSAADVPPGAIAVVKGKEVSKAQFDQLIAQARKSATTNKQEFPAVGTPEYEAAKTKIVQGLVEQKEWELEGESMGLKVTDEEVETRLDQLKQQFFQGDQKKYEDELERQGLTDQQVRAELRSRVLSDKIYKAVTKAVKVTDADIDAYYKKNAAQYAQPSSREVRHILVKTQAQGAKIYRQIKGGAGFATLAKKFTLDEASKADGGKFTAFKGRTVAPFDKFVFDAETGDLSKPIKTEFGWHVIEVISAVKPETTTPLADVKDSIRTTLLQQKQNQAMRTWIANLKKKYGDEVSYAPGYAPAASTDTGTGTTTG